MKGKDKKALHSKTVAELTSLSKEKQDKLANMRMELSMNKTKNVHAGKALKREIAIIETIKKVRQVAEELANG